MSRSAFHATKPTSYWRKMDKGYGRVAVAWSLILTRTERDRNLLQKSGTTRNTASLRNGLAYKVQYIKWHFLASLEIQVLILCGSFGWPTSCGLIASCHGEAKVLWKEKGAICLEPRLRNYTRWHFAKWCLLVLQWDGVTGFQTQRSEVGWSFVVWPQ